MPYQPTPFETASPQFDKTKTRVNGKIFTLTRRSKIPVDINNLQWKYLKGDGDFRSEEVKKLRDEADIIITNPPFSLFREFLPWISEGKKQFLIIANMNAITYKEVFPLIAANKIWLGVSSGARTYIRLEGGVQKMGNTCWFSNLEHGKRHKPLQLMTKADNLKFSRHKEIRENGYQKYDNYDAIEVPFTDAIPRDYDGIMGVPISFLDKYCPEQFEIVGATESEGKGFSQGLWNAKSRIAQPLINKKRIYKRLFIQPKGK